MSLAPRFTTLKHASDDTKLAELNRMAPMWAVRDDDRREVVVYAHGPRMAACMGGRVLLEPRDEKVLTVKRMHGKKGPASRWRVVAKWRQRESFITAVCAFHKGDLLVWVDPEPV